MKYFAVAASLITFCAAFAPASYAHEFWIDGTIVKADNVLELDLKVGQHLEGVSLPYIPDAIDTFEWVQGGSGRIAGTIGDLPAARVPLPRSESAIIFHRTKPRRLVHRDWEKFQQYVRAEGVPETVKVHEQRGLPLSEFAESYARHAKLVVLGEVSHSLEDRYMGSALEFVLETAEQTGNHIEITGRLIGQTDVGQHQISVFETTSDGARHSKALTDANGHFNVVTDGNGPLLLNSVQITPVLNNDTVWHSDWASVVVVVR